LGAESEAHPRGQCCGPGVGANQQQRRSKMPCEISKDDSKIPAKVIAKIKNYDSATAKQNSWLQISGWKKPPDSWYNQLEDAMIEIKTVQNPKPDHHYLVLFEGIPKVGKQMLRVDVGTLPFTKPKGT
jgi:hypothetical protein